LIRHLRRDGAQHEARQMLGEAKVLQKDLIPLMKDYHGDKELFSIVLRYNDTSPIAVSQYNKKKPPRRTPCAFCARGVRPFSACPGAVDGDGVNRSSHHQILKRLSPSKRRAEVEERP
jgi:hypothetical protein